MCCANSGWCGISDLHCLCDDCTDFRTAGAAQGNADVVPSAAFAHFIATNDLQNDFVEHLDKHSKTTKSKKFSKKLKRKLHHQINRMNKHFKKFGCPVETKLVRSGGT